MKNAYKYLLVIVLLIISSSVYAQDYFKMGCAEQDKANLDKAIEYYSLKIGQDPDFARAYINRGLCYQDKADFELALADFNKALELQPGDPAIHMSMGTVYFHLKKFKEAQQHLETALKVNPDHVNGQYDLGMTRHELKDYIGALKAFNAAIKLDPTKEKFYYSRALTRDKIGDYHGALEDFSRAIKLKPDYEKAIYFRAKEENKEQLYHDALADLDAVIKMNPENNRYYLERADIQNNLGNLKQALKDINKSLQLNDQTGVPFYTKAMIERDSGLIDSALVHMKQANALFKNSSPLAIYQLGMIKLYKRDYPGAIQNFEAALRINPNYTYADYMLIYARLYMRNDTGALMRIAKILSKDTVSARNYYLSGRIQIALMNQTNLARSNFEKAIVLNNDSQITAYCLAYLGKQAEAEAILNKRLADFNDKGLKIKARETYADFAFVYAVTKNESGFFKSINTALQSGYSFKSWVEDTPEFDYLRGKAEYKDLMGKYGLKK